MANGNIIEVIFFTRWNEIIINIKLKITSSKQITINTIDMTTLQFSVTILLTNWQIVQEIQHNSLTIIFSIQIDE